MATFNLRSAQETDAVKIRDLIRRVGINPFGLDWKRFVIAEAPDGTWIGCGQLKPHRDGSVELASLAVEEAYRGQGAAHAILKCLMAKSPRPLYLMCRPALVSFYSPFGFRKVDTMLLPPYFRRIRRLIRILTLFSNHHGPTVMRLD